MTATLTPPTPPPAGPGRPTSRGRGRAVRRAWIIGGSLVTAVALLFTLVQFVALMANETFVVEETIPAEDLLGVRVVEVVNGRGSVTIVGTGSDDIELTTEVSRGLRSPTYGWHIDGDRLVIAASCPRIFGQFCEIDHDVEIPRDMEVVLDVEEGSGSIADIDGPVEAENDYGGLELVRIGGPLQVRLHFGTLRGSQLTSPTASAEVGHGRVELAFAAAPQRITIDSSFADVDVSVPDEPGATYAVSIDTQFGQSTNGLRVDPNSTSSIQVVNEFGRVTLGYTP